jgi:hypothetical protein
MRELQLQHQHSNVRDFLQHGYGLRLQQLLQRHDVRAEENRWHSMRNQHRVRERNLRGPMLQLRNELLVSPTQLRKPFEEPRIRNRHLELEHHERRRIDRLG